MTDAMIPSSDSRVSRLRLPETQRIHFCSIRPPAVANMILSALFLNYLQAISCTRSHAHAVFRRIKLVVKATVSQLPGMIYITMVTLACSPLELLPSEELELRSVCIPFMASVSQSSLGTAAWVEAF